MLDTRLQTAWSPGAYFSRHTTFSATSCPTSPSSTSPADLQIGSPDRAARAVRRSGGFSCVPDRIPKSPCPCDAPFLRRTLWPTTRPRCRPPFLAATFSVTPRVTPPRVGPCVPVGSRPRPGPLAPALPRRGGARPGPCARFDRRPREPFECLKRNEKV